MSYAVKEIFYTLQGEGANTGRPAVFCRFAGCNLWSGREQTGPTAICRFCDTDFVGTDGPGGGRFAAPRRWPAAVAVAVAGRAMRPSGRSWSAPAASRCCSWIAAARRAARGGLRGRGRDQRHPSGARRHRLGLRQSQGRRRAGASDAGDELKLVFPQAGAEPERFESLDFRHFFLQPMDGPDREANTAAALRYCLAHPRWRLSLQTHKLLGIP